MQHSTLPRRMMQGVWNCMEWPEKWVARFGRTSRKTLWGFALVEIRHSSRGASRFFPIERMQKHIYAYADIRKIRGGTQ